MLVTKKSTTFSNDVVSSALDSFPYWLWPMRINQDAIPRIATQSIAISEMSFILNVKQWNIIWQKRINDFSDLNHPLTETQKRLIPDNPSVPDVETVLQIMPVKRIKQYQIEPSQIMQDKSSTQWISEIFYWKFLPQWCWCQNYVGDILTFSFYISLAVFKKDLLNQVGVWKLKH